MTPERDAAGLWLPGSSGNARGKPAGTKNRKRLPAAIPDASPPPLPALLAEVAATEAGAIVAALVGAMRRGDAQAAAVLLRACQAQAQPETTNL
jgi:hypothetical protein